MCVYMYIYLYVYTYIYINKYMYIGNKESRPKAGLSACNETEANAAIELTKFLLLCGCPQSSITIITPYKVE
jgi:hypothetical protein